MRKYNPLNVEELGRNAARALMDYPAADLPPSETFEGSGVYTLHYQGAFEVYASMANTEPIYVGKANPPAADRRHRVQRRRSIADWSSMRDP